MVRDPATSELPALVARVTTGIRPLTRVSYFLDSRLHGLEPAGFLATNLALHVAATLLVHALARRRLDEAGAAFAALVFALQPANAEVVAYVSGRSTGLMTVLALGGLLSWERARTRAALGCFALACLAKEVALVFPLLLVAWDATRSARRADSRRVLALAAVSAVVLAALLLGLARYQELLGFSLGLRSPLANLLANGRAVPAMLSLWLRPWALSPDHAFDPEGHFAASLAGLLAIAGALCAALAMRRRFPLAALALAWPLLALLPTNSLVPKLDLVTEKPLYLAWFGPALLFGAAAARLLAGVPTPRMRRLVAAGCAAAALALGAATQQRVALWRDPVRLWQDAVAKAPAESRCWNNLGMAQLGRGDDRAALASFRRALQLDPVNEIAAQNLRLAAALCGEACAAGDAGGEGGERP